MENKNDLEQIFDIVNETRGKTFLEVIEILEERNNDLLKLKNIISEKSFRRASIKILENTNTIIEIQKKLLKI